MKMVLHRKRKTNELYDVKFKCSPIQALIILDALKSYIDSEDVHEKDKMIAKIMLAEIRKEKK